MKFFKTLGTTLAATLMLVMALDYVALAATGQSLVLGKANRADQVTTIKNTGGGPAAKFVSQGAAIAVSNDSVVKKLNADKLDGKSAADLGVRTTLYKAEFGLDDSAGFQIFLDDVPKGRYLATYSGYFFGPNNGGNIDCALLNTAGPRVDAALANLQADGPENYYALHGADVFTISQGQDMIARCTGDTYDWFGEINVSLTEIDQLTRIDARVGPA
jgi:hypothetical protein